MSGEAANVLRCRVCPDGDNHYDHNLREQVAAAIRRFPNTEADQWIGPESILSRVKEHLVMSELSDTPDPSGIFADIEARRADEVFMERIKARAAEDGELLQRIADDEMLIADLRARLSHALAERNDIRCEAEVLVEILRRFTEGNAYYCWGENQRGKGFLTLDGTVDLSDEELATLSRVLGNDGRGWWNKSGHA